MRANREDEGEDEGTAPPTTAFDRIKEALPSLKPAGRKIALYLLSNGQTEGFSSTRDLGSRIGVSEASIVRFAQDLGFEGYIDLRRALEVDIRRKLGMADKITLSDLDLLPEAKRFERLRRNELSNLKKTLDEVELRSILAMAKGAAKARKVFVCGFGASSNMAHILEYGLQWLQWVEVVMVTGSVSDYSSRLASFSAQDVMILITFPPYSREIFPVISRAKEAGGELYLITDSLACPAYSEAAAAVLCENNSLLLTNSYVGVVAAIQIFVNMLALTRKAKSAAGIRAVLQSEREAYEKMARVKSSENRWPETEDSQSR